MVGEVVVLEDNKEDFAVDAVGIRLDEDQEIFKFCIVKRCLKYIIMDSDMYPYQGLSSLLNGFINYVLVKECGFR